MSAEVARTEMYSRLDAAVVELVHVLRDIHEAEHDCDENSESCLEPETVTDWVLVVGSQRYTEAGDRTGSMQLIPRHGSQPSYITAGLLNRALAFLNS